MTNRPNLRSLLKKKEIDFNKEVKLEKNDFLALIIAAASVFIPVIIAVALLFGVVIWLFIKFGLLAAIIGFFVIILLFGIYVRYKDEHRDPW